MGLAFIAVSIAQMCRGTVIIFVCALSYAVLHRKQLTYQLAGVALVLIGIALVSLSALRSPSGSNTSKYLLGGIGLCILAQVFQASMFVYEEMIMSKYTVRPLQVVGMEGLFGIFISAAILTCLQFTGHANTPGALHQIRSSPVLLWSVIGSMLAVAIFNFAGATVTQKSSAVARTTIKISSTIFIWIAELVFGWNTFSLLQLGGFIFVAFGTVIYNRILVIPFLENSGGMDAKAQKKGLDDEL
jgi:drug/metabolite transporter (DMT)-like permease